MTNLTNKQINENHTLNYVNEYLLNCETRQDDMLAYIDGMWEDVEVVDVLGTVEEEGRIYTGLEIVTSDFPFGHIIHINFMNMWEYVYKDEMIEISEKIGRAVGEQIEINIMLEKESK